jgi:RHS repeat-associated protein
VKIVESSGLTKQFVWDAGQIWETRDGTGTVQNQYFGLGQTIAGSNYFYTHDHLGSVKELTDTSGNIVASYNYDPYGRAAKVQGSLDADFQYAGYYVHKTSGLNLTANRAYSASLGRWINRDPASFRGGLNLYRYVNNNPISLIDPTGLNHTGVLPVPVLIPNLPGGLVGLLGEIGLIALSLKFLEQAIEELAEEKEKLQHGKDCLRNYKCDLEICKLYPTPHCEYEAYERFLKCLSDHDYDVDYLARLIRHKEAEAARLKQEYDELEKKLKEWNPP